MTEDRWRFPPELRTLSVVPRWSIVWILTNDSVANHSYFVTFYAREIAKLIDWSGDLGDLMYRALVHDAEESISGDIIGPAKDEMLDNERAKRYLHDQMRLRMPFVPVNLDIMRAFDPVEDDEAWRIVKAADKMDALIFTIIEQRLGNNFISQHMPRAWTRFEEKWRALPAGAPLLDNLWNDTIVPAMNEHLSNGGTGLTG